MDNKEKPVVKRKRNTTFSGKFYSAPVKIDKKTMTIELPIKVAEYFKLTKPEIYWAPVNGVIQLSGVMPQIVIPMMADTEQFGFQYE